MISKIKVVVSTPVHFTFVLRDWAGGKLASKEVSRCNTRDEIQTVHYVCLTKVSKAEPPVALDPRGDVTRNPKQGYQWPMNPAKM